MVGYWIMLATVSHVLRDRGFQAKVITGAIGAVALAQLGRDNQARPVRRAAGWYSKLGVSEELASVRASGELARAHVGEELAKVREALEPGPSSGG
jgi:hypothetical protein